MSRYSLVVAALFWAAGQAPAASWADGLFDELSKDFGSVPRGPTVTHSFRIVNNKNTAVNISNVRVSCGCTTAYAVKTYLNPGEETAVVARMDTNRFIGPRTVTIFVQFDRPHFEEVRLWVQANSRTDFAVTPDTLALGTVKRGSSPSGTVDVVFYGTTARITEIRSESNYIKPTFKEVRREGFESAYRVSAVMRSDAPVGKWYTDIWLKTDNATMPQIRVPLTVEIESALSLSTEGVALGQIKAQTESERRVILRGVKPFKITGFKGTDDQVGVRDSGSDSKAVHVLTVKVKADKPGEFTRTVRVQTDLEGSFIDFEVSAQVMP
jgi:hypothetical protein